MYLSKVRYEELIFFDDRLFFFCPTSQGASGGIAIAHAVTPGSVLGSLHTGTQPVSFASISKTPGRQRKLPNS
jgi:hypothetical protein